MIRKLYCLPVCLLLQLAGWAQGPAHPPAAQGTHLSGSAPLQPARAARPPAPLPTGEITLTIGKECGVIKDLLGVNVGPMPAGAPGNADLTSEYKRLGIRAVRTHDYYGPLDMSVMYPDLNADPANPAAFDFAAGDRVMRALLEGGFEPYFRIGDSWNNVRIPATPVQADRFARAAVQVVRHYTEGLWGGVKAPIRCVEIWNEPDLPRFWPDRYENFFPLYRKLFQALKTAFPRLQVGGPGFVVASYKIPEQRRRIVDFVKMLGENKIQPDFLSWHLYGNDPREYAEATAYYRGLLDRNGLNRTGLHLTEWNTDDRENVRPMRMGSLGASRLTAAWIALQDAPLDRAFFYRGNDTSPDLPTFYGLYFAGGQPKPIGRAFALWGELTRCPKRLAVSTGIPLLDAPATEGPADAFKPVWFLAGADEAGRILLLLTSAHEVVCHVRVGQEDLGAGTWRVEATLLATPNGDCRQVPLPQPRLLLKANDIVLLRLDRKNG